MQYAAIRAAVLYAALALCATFAQAAEDPAPKAKAAEKSVRAKPAKKEKQPIVDINRASKAELVKLPGVDKALAEKIIAARPYRTKAELVTRKVIPDGTYQGLKRRIVAKPK